MIIRVDRVNEVIEDIECDAWELDDKNNLILSRGPFPGAKLTSVPFYIVNSGEWESFRVNESA